MKNFIKLMKTFFNKLFTPVNLSKILVIFFIGLISRFLVNNYFDINVFKDYLTTISLIYYSTFTCFIVFIHELFSYFNIIIIPNFILEAFSWLNNLIKELLVWIISKIIDKKTYVSNMFSSSRNKHSSHRHSSSNPESSSSRHKSSRHKSSSSHHKSSSSHHKSSSSKHSHKSSSSVEKSSRYKDSSLSTYYDVSSNSGYAESSLPTYSYPGVRYSNYSNINYSSWGNDISNFEYSPSNYQNTFPNSEVSTLRSSVPSTPRFFV